MCNNFCTEDIQIFCLCQGAIWAWFPPAVGRAGYWACSYKDGVRPRPSFLCSWQKLKGLFISNICNFLPNQELQDSMMIGVIEGGDVLEERQRSARETAKRPVAGFLLDGFQGNTMAKEIKLELLSSVTADLPEDKPRSELSIIWIRSPLFVYHFCINCYTHLPHHTSGDVLLFGAENHILITYYTKTFWGSKQVWVQFCLVPCLSTSYFFHGWT